MKLVYFRGHVPNFGDELNTYMWQHLLPANFLDEDESELFIGIGSILWDTFPRTARKYVMGSGYAGYTGLPDVHDGTWDIVFVRGPQTARLLGIAPEKAICDSAVLLRALQLPAPAPAFDVGFMPHFESLDRGLWEEACKLAGISLIDPRDDVEKVISQIRGARMIITEAMHGAIVADALRTPWVAVKPINPSHRAKWQDWSGALSHEVRFSDLLPSSLVEFYIGMTGGRRGAANGRVGRLGRSALARPLNKLFTHRAAAHLQRMARTEPQLSRDEHVSGVTERALAALDGFVRSRQLSSTSLHLERARAPYR
ncbi:polysaccharide pyruvyl transferase family protein [Chelativorans sp. AA-79]|uniref:polysaccharide pyruvyl transferase family protein n=1 Tax=Chelativorans sp. AA-79 TaxID=3028735 RepID=UPI0023F93C0C|nr:polysaccharide pyruvyl transferase family protein [Chelativorans sp. AA-79]WEX08172.1 polysaccharide pyruvyl transferase family protein [Chelativorans sp. AA-79]